MLSLKDSLRKLKTDYVSKEAPPKLILILNML
jgi:hypothetical protein